MEGSRKEMSIVSVKCNVTEVIEKRTLMDSRPAPNLWLCLLSGSVALL